ncbi:glycyl-radical enzyme activating protein [Christensenella timonensis]|uniref:glycyl-radical enzyme activating protein n=1 Tax=Christensenella timonensis TaxID=1816678 RepID=UPI000834CBEF|nr:glycyl-radical enzyme activating protein [Christensenella timonensis]
MYQSEEIKGTVFDLQRYSIHDGSGIRTIVFLKGCPLRCRWCANPESQKKEREMMISHKKCIACGTCQAVCDKDAISVGADGIAYRKEKCDYCGACIANCRAQGLKIAGREMSVQEIIDEITKDEIFYITSGGGLTVSGGEPLSQHEFLLKLLKSAQERGIHTAIETCGVCAPEVFREVLKYVDLLLMDLKHTDNEKHKEWTGGSNEAILKNWEWAAKNKKHIICRIPVIPGFNDTEKEIKDIAKFISGIGIREMHLLPYHNLGESKYIALGMEYSMHDVKKPEDDAMQALRAAAMQYVESVQIGG